MRARRRKAVWTSCAAAARQHATLLAIRASFLPNNAEAQSLVGQYAASGIAQIRKIGRQATARAAEADGLAVRNPFEAQGDTHDRRSQSLSNYIRSQTVASRCNPATGSRHIQAT